MKKNLFSKFAKNSYFDSINNFTFPISLEIYDKIKNHKNFEIYFKEQLFLNLLGIFILLLKVIYLIKRKIYKVTRLSKSAPLLSPQNYNPR